VESLFKSVKDKTVLLSVLLTWNNGSHSSNVQDTVTELKEHIGGGHLSLEHVERLHLGIWVIFVYICVSLWFIYT